MPAEPATAAPPKPAAPAARAPGPGDHVFLVDGSSFVFRAYFQSMNQDAKYNYRSDGLPTGAVRLFCNKLYQFINEGAVGVRPTHLAIIFDKSEVTFRNEIYPDYKGTRKEAPDDLVPQFPLMRDAVEALGLHPVEQAGYEADDIIATYAKEASAAGADVLIISADKDLMQLVTPTVQFYDFESGSRGKPGYRPERKIDIEGVIDYFGVPPEKVIDVQSLVGDTSDNVPGVPGIGKKTASQLIEEYGDLESLLAKAEDIKQPKRRERLIEFADQARMSKQLVTLHDDVDVETPLADFAVPEFDAARFVAFLKAMELNAIAKRVAEANGVDPDAVEPDPRLKSKGRGTAANPGQIGSMAAGYTKGAIESPPPAPGGGDLFGRADVVVEAKGEEAETLEIGAGAAALAALVAAQPFDPSVYTTISDAAALDALIARANETGRLALFVVTDAAMPMAANIVGIAFATDIGGGAYLPLGHRNGDDDLLGGGLAEGQLDETQALAKLKPVLEDPSVLKLGYDLKVAALQLARRGIALTPIDDVMLLAYALEGGRRDVSLGGLGDRWLTHRPGGLKDLLGSGRNAVAAERLDIERHRAGRRRTCRRRRSSRDAAPSAARRRTRHHRLRDAGAADGSGPGGDGEGGHPRRPPHPLAPVARLRADHGAARGRDRHHRRRAVQHRLAETARRDPVRQDGDPRRAQDQDRRLVHRRRYAGGTRRRRSRTAGEDPRMASGVEAEIDLHRRAARLHQCRDRACAHILCARRDADGAPVIVRSEPPEHPDPHRARPQDQDRLRRRRRATS